MEKIKFKEWFPFEFNKNNSQIIIYIALLPILALIIAPIFYKIQFLDDMTILKFITRLGFSLMMWWGVLISLFLILYFIPYFIWASIVSKGHPIVQLKKDKLEEQKQERLERYRMEYLEKTQEERKNYIEEKELEYQKKLIYK